MALFKSRGLITGKTVCCDLTLTGQIVPVKSDSVCMVVVVVGDYLLVIISDGVMFENACVYPRCTCIHGIGSVRLASDQQHL